MHPALQSLKARFAEIDDLRRAGLSPGPVYTRLLGRLLDARLDGEVQDDEAEFALMKSLVSEALA